jgi:hypothetical protein
MAIIHPETLKEIANITEDDKAAFKELSEYLIARGSVERLSEVGLKQAIDNIAYEIAKMSMWSVFNIPKDEIEKDEDFLTHPVLGQPTKDLDNIINFTALGSGMHPALLGAMLDLRVQQYVDEMLPEHLK